MKKNYFKLFVSMLFVTNLMAQNIPSYVPTNGLLGWWPFNGNANDESGNGYHGTVNGATLTSDRNGKTSSAYDLANGNYITIKEFYNPVLASGSFSISLWVKTITDNPEMNVFCCRGNGPTCLVLQKGLQITCTYSDGGGFKNLDYYNSNVKDDNWHHLVMIYNGNEKILYIDNSLKSQTVEKFSLLINGLLEFGRDKPYGRYYTGQLDDIAIFNRAITATEVKDLYDSKSLTCGDVNFNQTLTYGIVKDVDGNEYKTIKIGNQEWLAENLRTTRFSNGDTIKYSSSKKSVISTVNGPTWTYYKDSSSLNCSFGKLYNFQVVSDERGVCPTGWKVASQEDWNILANSIGGWDKADKIKEVNTIRWNNGNLNSNSAGLTLLPGGCINGHSDLGGINTNGYYWTSSLGTNTINQYTNDNFFVRRVDFNNNMLYVLGDADIKCFANIRCVKSTGTDLKPIILTHSIDSVTSTSVVFRGEVTSTGGLTVNLRGFVIGETPDVNICSSLKTSNGSGIGVFSNKFTNLEQKKVYFVRSYASNNDGISYGNSVMFSLSSELPAYLPKTGLVGWWPFNGNANDESGNGNHGTVNGATLTSDRNGGIDKAYGFGINSTISLPSKSTIIGNNPRSISAWFNLNNFSNYTHTIYKGGNNGDGNDFSIWVITGTNNQNYFQIRRFNSDIRTSPITILPNQWHLISVTYNGINDYNTKIYIDGVLLTNFSIHPTGKTYNTTTTIPCFGNLEDQNGVNHYLRGMLDDIAIYNRALTQEEITALYLGCTKPSVAIIPKSTTNIKENESVVLAAKQGNGYTYAWYKDGVAITNATDSNYTATLPGVYNVKVTSAACDSTSAGVTVKRAYTLPNYLPTNGLVGWWPFNGNANDESGNENHGSVNGASLITDKYQKINSAYNFDGNSSFIALPLLNLSNKNEFTISSWVKITDFNSNYSNYHIIRQEGSGGLDWLLAFQNKGNIISFGLGIQGKTYSELDLSISASKFIGSWHNIVATYNGTVKKIYIDGILLGSESKNGLLTFTNSGSNAIGSACSNINCVEKIKGDLDDIAIYNRALTQEEITALYLGDCTKPLAAITPKSTTNIKEKESVILAATQGNGYTYAWYKDGVAIANATDSNYIATLPGVYTVKVTSAACDSTSAGVTVKRAYTLPNYLPTNGLVGWWPFNGNANDESGNGNHGTVNGATLTSDRNGVVNKAYSFDGINDCIDITNSNVFDWGQNIDLTISCWVKSNNPQNSWSVLSKYYQGDANNSSYALNYGANRITAYGNGTNAGWYYTSTPTDNSWVLINLVMNKNTKSTKIYKNGILIENGMVEYNISNSNVILSIGRMFAGEPGAINSNHFNGFIDDIAIYNRALTQEEITALYLGEACTTPIATITPQSATSFCSGGSVNINAATNANYTYQWLNNGAAISAATTATYKATTSGKYSVIVKNNSGCIDTSSVVTVTVTPTPSLPILTGPATLCYNSKAIFKASISGGTWGVSNDYLLISSPQGLFRNNKMPPSNLFKTGVTYTLKSKDQLCSVTAQKSVWIRNVAATSITLTASKQTLKVGEEVAATATTKITGNALFWMSASTSFVSVTGVSPYIALVKGLRPATGANITFSADDAAKGCRNTAFLPFTVTAAASMVENETNTSSFTTDLNVYPNPSNGIVTIENIGDAKTISLIDVTGRVLKTTPVNADRMRLDYSTITKGNYFISIQGETIKEMKSIVIE